MLQQEQLDTLINAFITDLRRKQISGSYTIALTTATLIREIIVQFKKNDTIQQLISQLRYFGQQLKKAHPTLFVVGNVTRRALYIVRDEFVRYTTENAKNEPINQDPITPLSSTNSLTRSAASFFGKLSNMDVSHRNNLASLLEMSAETDFNQVITDFDLKGVILDQIQSLIEEELEVFRNKEVFKEASQQHIHTNDVILTIGMSNSVESFLTVASSKKKHFDVIVSEGAPSFQGHEMVKRLSEAGISVTLIPDAAVFAVMSRVNKVVVGVQAVMANGGIIGDSGVHMAALAAKKHKVPFVVVTGSYKLTPLYPLGQDSFNVILNPNEIIPLSEHAQLEQVHVVNPAYDYVPPDLIDLFITNDGTYNTAYIYRQMGEYYDIRDYNLDDDA